MNRRQKIWTITAILLIAVAAISVHLHLQFSPRQTVARLAQAAGLGEFPEQSQVKIEAYRGPRGLLDVLRSGFPEQVSATVCVRFTGPIEEMRRYNRLVDAQAQTHGQLSMSEHRSEWSTADGTKWAVHTYALENQIRLYLNTTPPGDYDKEANNEMQATN
jgi:hypothetical protein